MKRLRATLQTDVRLQMRNGFYYAVAFILVAFAVLARSLPDLDWTYWLAPVVFGNLVTATYFFVGGLVLLEKSEGTLEAQVVTPLREAEYLGSKVATLAALSLVENLTLVMLLDGFQHRFVLLSVGVLLASVVYVLFGFIAVARYDSINEYLMPSVLVVTLLSIPYLDYFEVWRTPWMILHPMQGPLVLIRAAFVPVEASDYGLALLAAIIWSAAAFRWARRAFHHFVVRKEGVG